jgi:hypothetical protein
MTASDTELMWTILTVSSFWGVINFIGILYIQTYKYKHWNEEEHQRDLAAYKIYKEIKDDDVNITAEGSRNFPSKPFPKPTLQSSLMWSLLWGIGSAASLLFCAFIIAFII